MAWPAIPGFSEINEPKREVESAMVPGGGKLQEV